MAGEGIVKGREEWDRSVLEMDSESSHSLHTLSLHLLPDVERSGGMEVGAVNEMKLRNGKAWISHHYPNLWIGEEIAG